MTIYFGGLHHDHVKQTKNQLIKSFNAWCPWMEQVNLITYYFHINNTSPFLTTREAVVPLANNPIMLRKLIQSFRHLEHQNLFIISNSISITIVQQFRKKEMDQNRGVQLA